MYRKRQIIEKTIKIQQWTTKIWDHTVRKSKRSMKRQVRFRRKRRRKKEWERGSTWVSEWSEWVSWKSEWMNGSVWGFINPLTSQLITLLRSHTRVRLFTLISFPIPYCHKPFYIYIIMIKYIYIYIKFNSGKKNV